MAAETDFDRLLAERTKKGAATVHGAMMKCVDKHGTEIYSKIAGYDSVLDDAAPLLHDAVLKLGSATKLLTTVALLQCVDTGLLALDEPIARVLPELAPSRKPILEHVDDEAAAEQPLATRASTTPITARHLLAHTSGLGYWFSHPLLAKWRASAGAGAAESTKLTERLDYPLVFEPGRGWLYGCGVDWAGVAVSRLHGGVALEDYLIANVWTRVGRVAPFPTFHVEKHPAYASRLMRSAERTPADRTLKHSLGMGYCAHLDDDEGGAGLAATMGDVLAVLRDLLAECPALMRRETVDLMFQPQLVPGRSPAVPMLLQLRPAWDIVAGSVKAEEVNHGLGGLLVTGEVPEIGQPAGLLCWGGSPNIVWFVCRERGVAGFFGTQLAPFGDEGVRELVDGWKRDFWRELLG